MSERNILKEAQHLLSSSKTILENSKERIQKAADEYRDGLKKLEDQYKEKIAAVKEDYKNSLNK